MTLFVHVGVSKTGTTTLQQGVFALHSGINFLGKPWPTTSIGSAIEESIEAITALDGIQFNNQAVNMKAVIAIREAQKFKGVSLISQETLTTPTIVDRGLMAQRLKEVADDIKIIITIRDQIDALGSLYSNIRHRGDINIGAERWIKSQIPFGIQSGVGARIRQFNYFDLITYYENIFGENNVGVFLFEKMLREPEIFSREIASFLGVDEVEFNYLLNKSTHKNTASSSGEIYFHEFARWYSNLRDNIIDKCSFCGNIPLFLMIKQCIKQKLLDVCQRSTRMEFRLRQETMGKLKQYYSPGNGKLMAKRNLPLNRYGYSL